MGHRSSKSFIKLLPSLLICIPTYLKLSVHKNLFNASKKKQKIQLIRHFVWLCTVICIVYGCLSLFCWKSFILFAFAWTVLFFLSFFSFFCQSYQGLLNCKSVFLMLKVSKYGESRQWIQRFQGILIMLISRDKLKILYLH